MKKLFIFLIILGFAFPVFSEGWSGSTLRELGDVDSSIDPADEYGLEWDSTTELWVPVTRLEAEDLTTSTTNFGTNLSSADDTIQKALDTIDDLSISGSSDTLDNVSDRGATTDKAITTGGYATAGSFTDGTLTITGGNLTTTGSVATNNLVIANTAEPATSISTTSITGTDNQAIDISSGEALDATEYWTGIRIKPDDLDPGGADTRIRGIAINMSGVGGTLSDIDALRIIAPDSDTDAIRIREGKIRHLFTSGSDALAQYTVHDIVVDTSSQDSTSGTHAMDVALADGLTGRVAAVGTHTGIDVIHQHVGTFTAMGANYAGRLTSGPTYTDNVNSQNIWVANGDSILLGHSAAFDEIELVFTTVATKDVFLRFYYYNGGWVRFYPADDTDGGRHNGSIRFDGDDLVTAGWDSDYDPNGGTADAGYWIKIERNRVSTPGTVTLATAKYLVAVLYYWDKVGAVDALSLEADTFTDGTVIITNGTISDGTLSITNGNITSVATITASALHINDTNTIISEDGSSNMTFTDGVTSVKTLAELAASGAPEGTAVLSTGEGGASKYLREDGDGTCSWQTPAGGGDLLADGSVPMTSDWEFGNYDLTLKSITLDGTFTDGTLEISTGNIISVNTFTDGTLEIASGNITSAVNVSATTLTDGTVIITTGTISDGTLSITGGSISSGVSGTFSGQVSAGTLTDSTILITNGTLSDGTLSITGGDISSVGTITAETLTDGTIEIANGTFTDGTLSIATGNITAVNTFTDGTLVIAGGDITNVTTLTDGTLTIGSGNIIGVNTFTDGTLEIAAGEISSVIAITADTLTDGTILITNGTLSDGTLSITGGDISSVGTLTASTLTDGTIEISTGTLTDGTLSIAAGNISSAETITANTFTDGTLVIAGGDITGVTTLTDGTLTIGSGNIIGVNTFTDGTLEIAAGNVTSATNVSSSTLTSGSVIITNNTITDGTLSVTGGTISSGVAATFSAQVSAGTLTDGTVIITDGTITDGTLSITNGDLSSVGTITASTITDGTVIITAGTITDGTLSVAAGNITSAVNVSSSTLTDGTVIITTGTISDGTLAITGGSISSGVAGTFSAQLSAGTLTDGTVLITNGTMSDGTLSITGGNISSAGTITASTLTDGTIEISTGTLTDGTLSIAAGNISSAETITANTLTDGTVEISTGTITDGTLSIAAGNISSAETITANTFTDGTLEIASGNITSVGTFSDGTLAISNGIISSANSVTTSALTISSVGTFNGDIQLGETDIKLDATLSGDAKWSGIVIAGTSGVTTLAVGDLCYLNNDDGRWELVDANLSDGYDKQLGICVLAGADGAATEMLVYGKVRAATFPAFTVGSPLYISETAGDCTHTAPTTTDSATRVIGIAITAEDLMFNPSNNYYTHT